MRDVGEPLYAVTRIEHIIEVAQFMRLNRELLARRESLLLALLEEALGRVAWLEKQRLSPSPPTTQQYE